MVPAVAVLIVVGLHVPVIAGVLVELPGNNPGVAPTQYGPNAVNVGVIGDDNEIAEVPEIVQPLAIVVAVYVVFELGLA